MAEPTEQGSRDRPNSTLRISELGRMAWLVISILGTVGVLTNFSENLVAGLSILTGFVDLYRGIIYPLVDGLFNFVWPDSWTRPAREAIDVYSIQFFLQGLVTAYWFHQTDRFRLYRIPDVLNIIFRRFYSPLLGTLIVFGIDTVLVIITNDNIPLSYALFVFSAYFATAAIFRFNSVPLLVLSPYDWVKQKFFKLEFKLDSRRARLGRAGIMAMLALLVELNARADVALPAVERFGKAIESLVSDIAQTGRYLQEREQKGS